MLGVEVVNEGREKEVWGDVRWGRLAVEVEYLDCMGK